MTEYQQRMQMAVLRYLQEKDRKALEKIDEIQRRIEAINIAQAIYQVDKSQETARALKEAKQALPFAAHYVADRGYYVKTPTRRIYADGVEEG